MKAQDNYIQPGMNVTKCELCGYNKQGHINKGGGNVFVPIPMKLYEQVRLDCYYETEATCTNGHKTKVRFIHTLAPQANEETIRDLQKLFGRYY